MAPASVLVIDDSETDLLFAQIMLERGHADWSVVTMESASDALSWLQHPPAGLPRLILLDLNMPGMNGLEFLDAYEALPDPPRGLWPPVVVLSSSPLDLDRQRSLAHGCVRDYLVKPLTPDAVNLLAHWMRAGEGA